MLLRVGIYSIFLIMMLVKCILPDEKPEIIPLPQQSVLDKGDFIFDPTTLIRDKNKKQAIRKHSPNIPQTCCKSSRPV